MPSTTDAGGRRARSSRQATRPRRVHRRGCQLVTPGTATDPAKQGEPAPRPAPPPPLLPPLPSPPPLLSSTACALAPPGHLPGSHSGQLWGGAFAGPVPPPAPRCVTGLLLRVSPRPAPPLPLRLSPYPACGRVGPGLWGLGGLCVVLGVWPARVPSLPGGPHRQPGVPVPPACFVRTLGLSPSFPGSKRSPLSLLARGTPFVRPSLAAMGPGAAWRVFDFVLVGVCARS